jgi:hypothetical protein
MNMSEIKVLLAKHKLNLEKLEDIKIRLKQIIDDGIDHYKMEIHDESDNYMILKLDEGNIYLKFKNDVSFDFLSYLHDELLCKDILINSRRCAPYEYASKYIEVSIFLI